MERSARLATGLVLFAFAATHLINHMFGLHSIAAMEAARHLLLSPWQTLPGLVVLYGSFLTHLSLGLRALYRRRHFRIPADEALQLTLGLAIPLVFIPHAFAVRIGTSIYGFEYDYPILIYNYFVANPYFGLFRQFLLLVFLWLHGCLGLRAWLRWRSWYRHLAPTLAIVAVLVPTLGLIGMVDAGWEMRATVRADPAYASRFVLPPESPAAQADAARARVVDALSLLYLGLVGGILALRAGRNWHARRFHAVEVAYPDGRIVRVPVGFSVLEASRWAGIPHASACGGRGRCSTCRVRVLAGKERLPPRNDVERGTLARVRASEDVRLACQIRPAADIAVQPLVAPAAVDLRASRFDAAIQGGREMIIAALFVDLRESTTIASRRLPYDALFLLDRYVQAVTGAIRSHGGEVTSIAGDGVMSMFPAAGTAAGAATAALKAALQLWDRLDRLNEELAGELSRPLRVGIGIHVGLSVVGRLHDAEFPSLQFLGDVGNTAAKLEAMTKELGCTLLVSIPALAAAAPRLAVACKRTSVEVPGKPEGMAVVVVSTKAELQEIVSAFS